MPENKLKTFFEQLFIKIKGYNFEAKLVAKAQSLRKFVLSWWQLLLLAFASVIFLYYPLGGWMISNIDTSTDYEINTDNSQSATVEMMSFLVKREVSDNLWTPNLPFIFPSYFLDDMPSFQMGVISAISNMTTSFSRKLDKTIAAENERPLKNAAELLRYPGTIWMFSPQNKLTPVPSATSQYKRARKQLIAYNQSLREGSEIFYKSPYDLAYFLQQMNKDLVRSNNKLEDHIRENSSNFFDNRADNLFYYQKGKLYGYYLLFKALSYDYKEIILANDVYESWTKLMKALEDGSQLSPSIVRNGELDSTTAPNHLASIGWYTLKADLISQKIVNKIATSAPQGKVK